MDWWPIALLLGFYVLDAVDALIVAEKQRQRYGKTLRHWFHWFYATPQGKEDRRRYR